MSPININYKPQYSYYCYSKKLNYLNKSYKYEYYYYYNVPSRTIKLQKDNLKSVLLKSKTQLQKCGFKYLDPSHPEYIQHIRDKYRDQNLLDEVFNRQIFHNYIRHMHTTNINLLNENILKNETVHTFNLENKGLNDKYSKCEICFNLNSSDDNPIVFCDGCNVSYHIKCYNPSYNPSNITDLTEYFCDRCIFKNQYGKDAVCWLCAYPKGVLRHSRVNFDYTTDNINSHTVSMDQFAHPYCVILNSDLYYNFSQDQVYVHGNCKMNLNLRFKMPCMICNTTNGAVAKCEDEGCMLHYHIGCYLNVLRIDQKLTYEFILDNKLRCPFNFVKRDNMNYFHKILLERERLYRNEVNQISLEELVEIERELFNEGYKQLNKQQTNKEQLYKYHDDMWIQKKEKIGVCNTNIKDSIKVRKNKMEIKMNKLIDKNKKMNKIENVKQTHKHMNNKIKNTNTCLDNNIDINNTNNNKINNNIDSKININLSPIPNELKADYKFLKDRKIYIKQLDDNSYHKIKCELRTKIYSIKSKINESQNQNEIEILIKQKKDYKYSYNSLRNFKQYILNNNMNNVDNIETRNYTNAMEDCDSNSILNEFKINNTNYNSIDTNKITKEIEKCNIIEPINTNNSNNNIKESNLIENNINKNKNINTPQTINDENLLHNLMRTVNNPSNRIELGSCNQELNTNQIDIGNDSDSDRNERNILTDDEISENNNKRKRNELE